MLDIISIAASLSTSERDENDIVRSIGGRHSGETAENRNAWGGDPMRNKGIGRARFLADAWTTQGKRRATTSRNWRLVAGCWLLDIADAPKITIEKPLVHITAACDFWYVGPIKSNELLLRNGIFACEHFGVDLRSLMPEAFQRTYSKTDIPCTLEFVN